MTHNEAEIIHAVFFVNGYTNKNYNEKNYTIQQIIMNAFFLDLPM
jgi:hypothetical protein